MTRIGGDITPAATLPSARRACKAILAAVDAGSPESGPLPAPPFVGHSPRLRCRPPQMRCVRVPGRLPSVRRSILDELMKNGFKNKCISTASVLLLATLFACGGGGSSSSNGVTDPGPTVPPVNSSTTSLEVENNKYVPAHDSVGVGATLTWTWNSCTSDGYGGSTCTAHSVKFDDGVSSSPIQSSGTFSRTFATAGTYTYHCAVHGTAMSGTVLVK
jgi:plastocyanin